MPLPQGSRGSASGPISIRMATTPKHLLNTSFDWNGIREAYVVATENDACNGVAMLFGHLLTNRAQIFSDVRTYWSPEAVKRVTGKELTGMAANGIIHLD